MALAVKGFFEGLEGCLLSERITLGRRAVQTGTVLRMRFARGVSILGRKTEERTLPAAVIPGLVRVCLKRKKPLPCLGEDLDSDSEWKFD